MLSVTFHNSFFSDQGVTVWIAIFWQLEEVPQLESGSWDGARGAWSRWKVKKWVRWGRRGKVCPTVSYFADLDFALLPGLRKWVPPVGQLGHRWSKRCCFNVNSRAPLIRWISVLEETCRVIPPPTQWQAHVLKGHLGPEIVVLLLESEAEEKRSAWKSKRRKGATPQISLQCPRSAPFSAIHSVSPSGVTQQRLH